MTADRDLNTEVIPSEKLRAVLIEHLHPATGDYVVCSGERLKTDTEGLEDGVSIEDVNPVEFPGGSFLHLDVLKIHRGYSELEAREKLARSSLPIGFHDGPEHNHEGQEAHGPRGCGYENTVENEPDSIGALESVSANERYQWAHGLLEEGRHNTTKYSVHGPHQVFATYANYRDRTSIDAPKAWNDRVAMLGFDVWAFREQAERLRDEVDPDIDVDTYVQIGLDMFVKLGGRLAPGVPHIVLDVEDQSSQVSTLRRAEFA